MSIEPYASLEELQAHIDATGGVSWQAADVTNMQTALDAATLWIDERMHTRYRAIAETRHYSARWRDLLHVDDLTALTELATDEDGDGVCETVWAATDYVLEPFNAPQSGHPYRQIRIKPSGAQTFTVSAEPTVAVTGDFGYSVTPPASIRQACLILAHRLWLRKDAVFGVVGTPGLGVTVVQAQISADADVVALLDGVNRRHV